MPSLVNRLRIMGGLRRPSMAELHIEDPAKMTDLLEHECDSSLHFALEAGANQFTSNSAELDIMDYQDLPHEEIRQFVMDGVEAAFVEPDPSIVPEPDGEPLERIVIPKANRVEMHGSSIAFEGEAGHICETAKGIRHYSAVMDENKE